MDRIAAMRSFVRVAELGSFAEVARQQDVARSVVTRQIAALERALQVRLFARSTRRVVLTAAGRGYLERCRQILDLLDAAEAEVARERAEARGPIRVSLPLSFGLARLTPLLLDFATANTEVRLELSFDDRHVDLVGEGFDAAVRVTSALAPEDVARRLGEQRLLTVAAPQYLSKAGRPAHPRDLAAHACLCYSGEAQRRAWSYTINGRVEQVAVVPRLGASNGEALREAALRGMGIARLPEFIVADAVRAGRLVCLLPRFEPPPLGVHALLPGARYLPHRVRLLLDFLAAGLAGGERRGPARPRSRERTTAVTRA